MHDRIPTYPGRVKLTPVAGQENTYDLIRADQAVQEGDKLNKAFLLTDETAGKLGLGEDATVNQALEKLSADNSWKPLASYDVAGSYTFTVPNDVDELGALIIGGGGSGGAAKVNSSSYYCCGVGGASGYLINMVLSKANGDFSTGQEIPVVVGAGGESVTNSTANNRVNGNNGGTSSFNGITANGGDGGVGRWSGTNGAQEGASGGQCSDGVNMCDGAITSSSFAPYGFVDVQSVVASCGGYAEYVSQMVRKNGNHQTDAKNMFDFHDQHIYGGAGGCAQADSSGVYAQKVVTRTKGSSGAGAAAKSDAIAGNATAPGDGGGAACVYGNYTATSGAGHDGLVLVYGRRTA